MPPKKNVKGKGKGKDTDNSTHDVPKKTNLQKKKEENPHDGLPLYLTEGTTQKDRDVILEFSLSTPNNSRELVKQATLRLVYGRHYGLIGQNGIGKTTLLNAISQYQLVGFPQYLRVVHVHQEEIPRDDIHIPVIDYIIQSDVVKNFLESEEQRLLDLMENVKESADESENEDEAALDMSRFQKYETQLDEVYRRLDTIGARTASARARAILTGLQFTQEMQDNPISKLSGGWKMRVRLACALFVTPDILLLDEPTNHLDFPAVEWLSSFLRCYEPTLLVVSHDRGFLDNIMTDCIDFRDQTLMYYRGDYSNYVKVRAETIKRHNRLYEKTEKKRQALHKFIMEARQKAKDDPNLAEMARSRQRILDSLPHLEEIKADKAIHFTFPDPGSLDHAIVSCKKMSFHYDPKVDGINQPYLLSNIDAFIDLTSRIGVLGANGAGKTTLINVLLGKLRQSNGEVKLNDQARAKIFTQHHLDQLDNSMTSLQFLQHKFPSHNEGMLRGYLGRFGFDKILAEQKIEKLSGGQKSRVAFAVLTFSQPHLVIMDEPTNHLDIETIESLIDALRAFKGGVIIISHDRYFLSQIAEEYWAVDVRGTMKIFYELEDAKDYAYEPIEFKVDGVLVKSTAKLHKADPNKMKQYDVENDEDVRYRELESAYDDNDDDDDDAILAKLDKKAGDLERINQKKNQPSKKGEKATVYKLNLPLEGTGKKNKKQESSEEEVSYVPAKSQGFAAFGSNLFGNDDDSDDDDEEVESEEEKEAYVPVIHKHVQVNKKKQAKRQAAADEKAAEEEATRIAAEEEAARIAAEAAANKKAPKAKKGKKTKQMDDGDDDDLDAQLAKLTASLDADGDEGSVPTKPKKGKKSKKTVVDDDEEINLDDLLAGLGDIQLDEETEPALKKKTKKGKKSKDEEMDLGDMDLDNMLSSLVGDLDQEETAPSKTKKGKKGKKSATADEEGDDIDDMLARMATDLAADEDAAVAKDKRKAKLAAKKAAAAAEDEDDESSTVPKAVQQAKRRGK